MIVDTRTYLGPALLPGRRLRSKAALVEVEKEGLVVVRALELEAAKEGTLALEDRAIKELAASRCCSPSPREATPTVCALERPWLLLDASLFSALSLRVAGVFSEVVAESRSELVGEPMTVPEFRHCLVVGVSGAADFLRLSGMKASRAA